MPHKPIHIICVQGLSDGRVMVEPMADDFTGEPIASMAPKAIPVPPSAQSVIDAKNVAKAEGKRQLLQSVGILSERQVPKAVAAPTPTRLMIVVEPKKWRRI